MGHMTGPEDNRPRPIYDQIQPFGVVSPEQWNADQNLRIERLNKIVIPLVEKQPIPDGAMDFVATKISELKNLCSLTSNQASAILVGSDVNLANTDDYISFDYVNQSPYHQLDKLHTHSQETLQAANILLNALTPELGLNITDNYDQIIEKAKQMEDTKIADIDNENSDIHEPWLIHFSTVIPGITVFISHRNEGLQKTEICWEISAMVWK